jgi:fumarylacetoacetate (FAA) hydrolase
MKLATYRDGSRDGQLVVVARDLVSAHYATGIATRLQQALDDWNFISPQLHELATSLDAGRARHAFAFDPRRCMAPLPRAYHHAAGAACVTHSDGRTGHADLTEAPAGPRLVQCSGDNFLGPCDDIVGADEAWRLDFGVALAIVTGDVPAGASSEAALEGVRLVLLANALSLRALMPGELAPRCGLVQSRPATAFGPVALTPDELGDAWRGGRVWLDLHGGLNGAELGRCATGPGLRFHFGELISHLAHTRGLGAGTLVVSDTLSDTDLPGNCFRLAEKRSDEPRADEAPAVACLRHGDVLRIEMHDGRARSAFGAIEQTVRFASAAQRLQAS